jgi:CspA family cold shock protein
MSWAANILGDNTMANGTVKWFNSTKGFGFIAPESGGKDVFVHISAVERSGLTGLADDQKVTYDIESGRDGRESAVNLQLA